MLSEVDRIDVCGACLVVIGGDPAICDDAMQAACVLVGEGLARTWPGHTIQATGEGEAAFSWSACEGCGNPDGGDRHQAAVFATVPDPDRAAPARVGSDCGTPADPGR